MNLNWFGPIGATGYGRISRYLVPSIAKLGHNVNVLPIYPQEFPSADEEIKKFIDPISESHLDADVGIRLSIANPADVMTFVGKKRIFYNMLENDKIPPVWVKSLNLVDEVWVPSTWGKKVYKNSGVETPINVVPCGVDLGIFNQYREPLIRRRAKRERKFRFLFVGKWEHRKGVDIITKAFSEEFGKDEAVELILHCNSIKMFIPNFDIYRALLQLRLTNDRPEIKVIDGMITEYRNMGRLYTSADCFINPTRGEGWNLPLLEAMASGLPAITTNWSAHTDFANKKNAYMIDKYEMVPSIHPNQMSGYYLKFGKWAEPDLEEVKAKMRHVFENQDEAKKIGEIASRDAEKWTWDEAAKKATKHLEKLVK